MGRGGILDHEYKTPRLGAPFTLSAIWAKYKLAKLSITLVERKNRMIVLRYKLNKINCHPRN